MKNDEELKGLLLAPLAFVSPSLLLTDLAAGAGHANAVRVCGFDGGAGAGSRVLGEAEVVV